MQLLIVSLVEAEVISLHDLLGLPNHQLGRGGVDGLVAVVLLRVSVEVGVRLILDPAGSWEDLGDGNGIA